MKIPILHLEEGNHHFEDIIKSGTLHFYRDDIYPNDVSVQVDLNKFEKNIACTVNLSTRARHQCDRCLAPYEREVREQFSLLFHLDEKGLDTDEDEVILLSPDVKEIDINPFVKETLILSIPMKQLCREDCRGICPGCGVDLNKAVCVCPEAALDPRWEKLKMLKK